MVNIALIGAGYWGEKWIRTIRSARKAGLTDVSLHAIVDPDESRWAAFVNETCICVHNVEEMLDKCGEAVDAAIVATPASTHVPVVLELLEANKHVLVEKPPALSLRGLDELVARRGDQVLMVGLTYLHHPGIEYMRDHMFGNGEAFGKPLYARCRWTNDGIVREDVDVAWNVLVHPLSILLDLFGRDSTPVVRDWVPGKFLRDDRADFGMLLMSIGNCEISIEVSWLDSKKRRDVWIQGEHQSIWFDETGRNLELYASAVPALSLNWSFGNGLSPLEQELCRFVGAIERGENCITPIDCRIVRQVTEILQMAGGEKWEIWKPCGVSEET